MKEYEKIFKALANSRRLQIIKYLKFKKKATVTDISEHIRLSFKSTSRHLSILYSSGVVDREQKNLSVFYSLLNISDCPLKTIIKLI